MGTCMLCGGETSSVGRCKNCNLSNKLTKKRGGYYHFFFGGNRIVKIPAEGNLSLEEFLDKHKGKVMDMIKEQERHDEESNPKKYVKEYKRTCNECGKEWHSLESREKKIEQDIKDIENPCTKSCITCCALPGDDLQARRNVNANQSELDRLRKCPNCSSQNYKQEIITYEKQE